MDTSTPSGSPMLRKSMRQSRVAIEEDEEDQEIDLRNRRLEAINKSTNLKRRSVAAPLAVSLNPAQLAQHCKDCIKLSAENKINSKNAFNFLIIDVMAAMAKKSDSEMSQNFQVATSTLDASVKIYGYRVDAVHTDAMKMAGGLLNKELQQALDGGDDNNDEDEEGESNKTIKVKKRKRKYTVVAASTLNAKSESEVLLDVPPKKTVLSRGGEGTQLLTHVPKYNDSCLLMVQADTPCWPFDENLKQMPQFPTSEVFDVHTIMDIFSKLPINSGDKLCETVSDIQFGADCEQEPDFEVSQSSAFEFDVDASVQDVGCDEPMAPAQRLQVPCGGYDSGDDIALPEAPVNEAPPRTITELTRRLSVQNKEYSMFDEKILKSWAGPMYGNWRPTRITSSENKENTEGDCLKAGAKRVRRTRQKETISKWFEIPEKEVSRYLVQSSKAILAKSTLCNWKSATVTLTTDYKYSPEQLFSLFNLSLGVEDCEKNDVEVDIEDDDEVWGGEILDSSHNEAADEPAEVSMHEVEEWDAENMVAVPIKVEKISVGKFQKPKHVDMKQLKTCIWGVISAEDNEDKKIQFDELFKVCQARLPKKVAETVSIPILFNALLHLANEKSLVLTQKKDIDGFTISV